MKAGTGRIAQPFAGANFDPPFFILILRRKKLKLLLELSLRA